MSLKTQTNQIVRAGGVWLTREREVPVHDLFDYVYIFAIGGTAGTLYEECLTFALKGVFENRSGSIITPVNWVYGIGAVLIFAVLRHVRRPAQYFVFGALLGGTAEYMLSVLQELLLGTRSWDYSDRPLNIGGRTTVPYMLVWGVLCCVFMCFVAPPLLRLIHRIPVRIRHGVAIALAAVMLLDLSLMLPAIIRYGQRADGLAARNFYERWVDAVFNDAFMRTHYPNMRV